jgi:hypothetical protein
MHIGYATEIKWMITVEEDDQYLLLAFNHEDSLTPNY